MQKIVLIGSGGSGKSTLALRLGAALGIEVFHLDALLWKPGWVLATREEMIAIQRKLVAGEQWIIDGNYGETMELRLAAADTIILLDLPPALCLSRVLRRRLSNLGRTRPDMADGCPEPRWITREDRIFFARVWNFRREALPAILRRLEAVDEGARVITLRSTAEIERLMVTLGL